MLWQGSPPQLTKIQEGEDYRVPVYRFGVDTGQDGDYDHIAADLRSDVEQRHTPAALHDPGSLDLALARKMADEIINVSGAEVYVYPRTDNQAYDRVFDADADPTYWNPVSMKAYFKPQALELILEKWGATSETKTEITFSFHQLYLLFGERMVRVGDVVRVPWNGPNQQLTPKYFRITNATPAGNFRYHWLYYTCAVESLTADITVRPDDAAPMPVEIPDQGVWRESL